LEDLGKLNLQGIHWVIVGGESGPGARPIDPSWVRNIHVDCQNQQVPFFFKQWGGVRKATTGRTLDGKTYDEFPAIPRNAVAHSDRRSELLAALGSG
jgi:protein gp37